MSYRIINIEKIPDIASSLGVASLPDTLDFDYVGKWRVNIHPSGYGDAHRIALKHDYEQDGAKYLLIVHFAVPLAREDLRMPIELIQRIYDNLTELIDETATLSSQRFGNIASMHPATPDYMKKELEIVLQQPEFNPFPK